jgi:hypothetical protein
MMKLEWAQWGATLKEAIVKVVARDLAPEEAAERIMEILDQERLIVYGSRGRGRLLSAQGRMLVAVMECPDASLAELGSMVGVSDQHAGRLMQFLLTKGFVVRTKVGRGWVYEVDGEAVLGHPEIIRVAEILFVYAEKLLSGPDDIQG